MKTEELTSFHPLCAKEEGFPVCVGIEQPIGFLRTQHKMIFSTSHDGDITVMCAPHELDQL